MYLTVKVFYYIILSKINSNLTAKMIYEIKENKKRYIDLLLLADEQESMINRYIEKSVMYVLDDNGIKAEIVVDDNGNGILEIKNLAVAPQYQRKGYGKMLIDYIQNAYKNRFVGLQVGTGESSLTIPFYKKCGFTECGRIKNFFTDNYDHKIIENGVQLVDMIILQKQINL